VLCRAGGKPGGAGKPSGKTSGKEAAAPEVQLTGEERELIVKRLHAVLRPFLLRRVKEQVRRLIVVLGRTFLMLVCFHGILDGVVGAAGSTAEERAPRHVRDVGSANREQAHLLS